MNPNNSKTNKNDCGCGKPLKTVDPRRKKPATVKIIKKRNHLK